MTTTYKIRIVHPLAPEPFYAKQEGSQALYIVTIKKFAALLPELIADYGYLSEIHLVPNS